MSLVGPQAKRQNLLTCAASVNFVTRDRLVFRSHRSSRALVLLALPGLRYRSWRNGTPSSRRDAFTASAASLLHL